MKKSLLALAVLGAFAGAASAQSSVTIYGSLDMAVMHSNGGTASNGPGLFGSGGAPSGSFSGLRKGYYVNQSNGSRLGFRGNEDIGGGLSAQFQIEHRFSPDDGVAASPSFWQGRSYVQVSSAAAGRIYMGRDYTPAFWPAVKSDPFGWDGVAQLGPMQWARFLSPQAVAGGSSVNVRTANTVGYKSPDLGGLTIQVAQGLGESSGAGNDTGFNVEYGAGPIYAALAYEKVKGGSQAASADGNSLVNMALHYDLGVVKLMGYLARSKTGPSAALVSNKFYSLGALAPIGGGNLKAVIARLDPAGASNNSTKFGIGYDYYLSKRTNVYADLGLTRSDGLTNNTMYSFGMKHTF